MVAVREFSPVVIRQAILAMIASAACWGLGMVMSKYTVSAVPPVTLLVVQLLASVSVLWLMTALRRMPITWSWGTLRKGMTGVLEPGLAYLAGLIGLTMTSSSSASLISAMEPFMIAALAWVLLRERITRRAGLLMLLAVCGVVLVTGAESGGAGQTSLPGDLLILLGTGFAALYVISSRRSVLGLDPLPLAALQQSFGLLLALLALPWALTLGGEQTHIAQVPLSAWGWSLLTGVVQYAMAFLLYLNALKVLPATRAALFLTLIPLFGVGGSALFLGEALTAVQITGGGLILLALIGLRTGATHTD